VQKGCFNIYGAVTYMIIASQNLTQQCHLASTRWIALSVLITSYRSYICTSQALLHEMLQGASNNLKLSELLTRFGVLMTMVGHEKKTSDL